MIKVKIYGKLSQHFHQAEFVTEASSMKQLIKEVSEKCQTNINFKHQLIFVNKEHKRGYNKIQLKSGDVITILSPVSGG